MWSVILCYNKIRKKKKYHDVKQWCLPIMKWKKINNVLVCNLKHKFSTFKRLLLLHFGTEYNEKNVQRMFQPVRTNLQRRFVIFDKDLPRFAYIWTLSLLPDQHQKFWKFETCKQCNFSRLFCCNSDCASNNCVLHIFYGCWSLINGLKEFEIYSL